MLQLFNSYVEKGKIYEALLVGQNLAYKNCNKDNFEAYWNLLIKLANETEDFIMASKYLDQANAVLAFFAENVTISQEYVDYLIEKRHEFDQTNLKLTEKLKCKEEEIINSKVKYNDDSLALIEKLAESLLSVSSESEFEKKIEQIRQIDINIEKDYLTQDQKNKYEKLTTKCSQYVAKKTSEFEHIKNIEYNNAAVEAYERAYNFIKTGNGFDAHQDIIKNVFSFDASRLFSETIIYYNHVYSYIFGKLSDEEKLMFTKVAINLQKKR